MVFLLVVATKLFIYFTSLNRGMKNLKPRNNSSRIMLLPYTLKDITMIHNDIPGLHMCFPERRNFCREAWQKRYGFIQIENDLDDMYSIKNVSASKITAVPETTAFQNFQVCNKSPCFSKDMAVFNRFVHIYLYSYMSNYMNQV